MLAYNCPIISIQFRWSNNPKEFAESVIRSDISRYSSVLGLITLPNNIQVSAFIDKNLGTLWIISNKTPEEWFPLMINLLQEEVVRRD